MTKTQTVNELRKKVALACRIIGDRGVTKGSFGHVSARIPGTGESCIRLAVLVEMFPGMPDGRSLAQAFA